MTENKSESSQQQPTSAYARLWEAFKRYATLKGEDMKLVVSEKTSIVVCTLIVGIVVTLLGTATLTFLSFAAAHWIGESLGMSWAFLIIAGFYLILIGLIVLLRKPLIIDPVTRFITKIILS